jgi:hypothetical protein
MPDVCLSPPSPPAGPVPIPYPNFSAASDTTDGTTTVKIAGGQAGIKNKSSYKQSKGDEAATKSLGMGVVTATIQGKTYFAAWSSDVKLEGENAIRLSDLTTHNHASTPQNSGSTTASTGTFTPGSREVSCEELTDDAKAAKKKSRSGKHKPGRTFAAGQYNPPSGAGQRTTSSSHMSEIKNKAGMAKGRKDDNEFKETEMCAAGKEKLRKHKKKGTKYVDWGRSDNQGGMCHAESRIIESVFATFGKNPGGTLTFSIRQKKSNGDMLDEPCEDHCQDMLCAAQECDIKIKICKDGKPENLECRE